MLHVRIELLPNGDETLTRQLATMSVTNDGTGTPTNGHYNIVLTHVEHDGSTFTKTARIQDWDPERPAVELVSAALSVVHPLKRTMSSFTKENSDGFSGQV